LVEIRGINAVPDLVARLGVEESSSISAKRKRNCNECAALIMTCLCRKKEANKERGSSYMGGIIDIM
jgi:hypothetical protein